MLYLDEKGIICATDVKEHVTKNYIWAFVMTGDTSRPLCRLTWWSRHVYAWSTRFGVTVKHISYSDGEDFVVDFWQTYMDKLGQVLLETIKRHGHWYDEGFGLFDDMAHLEACLKEFTEKIADI